LLLYNTIKELTKHVMYIILATLVSMLESKPNNFMNMITNSAFLSTLFRRVVQIMEVLGGVWKCLAF